MPLALLRALGAARGDALITVAGDLVLPNRA
jgi:hypothetical protein